jgi:hypothetical protein
MNTTTATGATSSVVALRHTAGGGGAFPIVDDDLLRHICSYVGDGQYLFIGSVNRVFEKSYTSLFPKKWTYIQASTVERAKFYWQNIEASDDKHRQMLWHSAARYGNIDVFRQIPLLTLIDLKYHLCAAAAKYGQMKLLQWACNENLSAYKWDEGEVCINALGHGHLDVFLWALKYGFKFDDDIALDAAYEACRNGQVEALNWLLDHNYDCVEAKLVDAVRMRLLMDNSMF